MAIDVRIQVALLDQTAAGFRAIAANSRAAFAAVDAAAKASTTTSAKLDTAGRNLATTGGLVALPLIGIGIAATKEAIAVESAMADVNKVLGKAETQAANVENSLIALSTRAKDAIPVTVKGLTEIAAAGGQLGIPAKDIVAFTEVTAKMATAFDVDANKAGESAARLRNVFSLDKGGGTTQLVALGDVINQLSNTAASSAPDIVEAMTRIGGATRNFGLSSAQAAALASSIISLGNAPENTATAINSILPALQGATGQTKRFQRGLTATGISAKQMQSAVAQDGVGAINLLITSLNKLDPQARSLAIQDMFGQGIDARVLATLSNDAGQLSLALKTIGNESAVAGSMQREFATRSATTANAMIILKNNVTAMAITVGKLFLPAIASAVGMVNPILSGITAFAQAHPQLTKLAVGAIVVVAALASLLVVAGGLLMFAGSAIAAVSTIGTAIAAVSALASGGVAALGLFLSAAGIAVASVGGIGVVLAAVGAIAFPIAAVVALAVSAFLVIRNWRQVSTFFLGLWTQVSSAANVAWSTIVAGGRIAVGAIAQVMLPVVSILTAPMRFVVGVWIGIFQELHRNVARPVSDTFALIRGLVVAGGSLITTSIRATATGAIAIVSGIAAPVGMAIGGAIAVIQFHLENGKAVVVGTVIAIGMVLQDLGTAFVQVSTRVGEGASFVVTKVMAIAASLLTAQNAGQRFGVVIAQALGQTIASIVRFGSQFFLAGANLIGQLINGIKSKIGEIAATVSNATAQARAYLPFSPAKTGALSDLDKVSLLGTVATSVQADTVPLLGAVAIAMQQVKSLLGNELQNLKGVGLPPQLGTVATQPFDPAKAIAQYPQRSGVAAPAPGFDQRSGVATPVNQGGNVLNNTEAPPRLAATAIAPQGTVVVHYSPTITFGGSPSSPADQATFRDELARNRDEVARIVNSLVRDKTRTAY